MSKKNRERREERRSKDRGSGGIGKFLLTAGVTMATFIALDKVVPQAPVTPMGFAPR